MIQWTEERTKLAKECFEEGLSATQTCARMCIPDLTRNAVIGKWHRLKLWGTRNRQSPKINRPVSGPRMRKERTFKVQGPRLAEIEQVFPESILDPNEIPRHQRKTMETLEPRNCRFSYGDVGTADFFFCGAPRIDPHIEQGRDGYQAYCAMHHLLTHEPARLRRRPFVPRERSETSAGTSWR